MNSDKNCKYKVNFEMIVTKEETLSLHTIFVNKADVLNGIRIETGYHWKKYSYSKHSSHNKNKVINNKTVNE